MSQPDESKQPSSQSPPDLQELLSRHAEERQQEAKWLLKCGVPMLAVGGIGSVSFLADGEGDTKLLIFAALFVIGLLFTVAGLIKQFGHQDPN